MHTITGIAVAVASPALPWSTHHYRCRTTRQPWSLAQVAAILLVTRLVDQRDVSPLMWWALG